MNESCHIWMSHVTYAWVMSYMNESCPIWMSHVPYESCHIWMSHVPCPIWMSHVIFEWVVGHIIESCPIWLSKLLVCCSVLRCSVLQCVAVCTWVMPDMTEWVITVSVKPSYFENPGDLLCGFDVSHMNAISTGHVTYEWAMPNINESCHICVWRVWHVTYEWVRYEWVWHMNVCCSAVCCSLLQCVAVCMTCVTCHI